MSNSRANHCAGVTGGIAAYKACEVVSRLKKAQAQVHVIMTKNACEFVRPLSFQTLSGNPVATDTFANPQFWEVEHIALAQKADLFVVAPATANVIAKLAHGLADDMLTTTILATKAPVLISPGDEHQMYQAEVTQHNLNLAAQPRRSAVGPAGGLLACGDIGPYERAGGHCGRYPADAAPQWIMRLKPVTAGPTR